MVRRILRMWAVAIGPPPEPPLLHLIILEMAANQVQYSQYNKQKKHLLQPQIRTSASATRGGGWVLWHLPAANVILTLQIATPPNAVRRSTDPNICARTRCFCRCPPSPSAVTVSIFVLTSSFHHLHLFVPNQQYTFCAVHSVLSLPPGVTYRWVQYIRVVFPPPPLLPLPSFPIPSLDLPKYVTCSFG